MDPVIAAVVSALSAGALAMTKGVATAAAKDAYGALKAFIINRVGAAEPFVEVVHEEPGQEAAGLLAKKLTPLAGIPKPSNSQRRCGPPSSRWQTDPARSLPSN